MHAVAITQTSDWPRQFNCHGNTLNRILNHLESLGKIIRNGQEISVNRCTSELERAGKRVEKARENGSKPKRIKDLGEADASGASFPKPETKQRTKNKIQIPALSLGEDPPATPEKKKSNAGR